MDGVEVVCQQCALEFSVCVSCWKNQRYCSKCCAEEGRRHSHREAQKKYSKTAKGRVSQKTRSRRYRLKKSVTDQCSNKKTKPLKNKPVKRICIECGRRIEFFLFFESLNQDFVSLRRLRDVESGPAG